MLEHVSDEGDDVEAGECWGVALVVRDRPAAAYSPGEGSLHDAASGQQDEAVPGVRQSDDVQRDALGCGGICDWLESTWFGGHPEAFGRGAPDVENLPSIEA